MGDSAGGNLCLALTRYLAELAASREDDKREGQGKGVGQPGGMVLFSASASADCLRGWGQLIASRWFHSPGWI
jgi:acetyl esterase/lipase